MNICKILLLSFSIFAITVISRPASAGPAVFLVKPTDSLRVGVLIKGLNPLLTELQDSILPKLDNEEKKNFKTLVSELRNFQKSIAGKFQDTMLTDFTRLSEAEQKLVRNIEAQIVKIKSALPEKSVSYHRVALRHLPFYVAVQEMNPDVKIPLLSTYLEAYDPNTSKNFQVIMKGAFLNFYLEYRMSVGGIEMGPDIVDPERLVFTFPEKLFEGMTGPTWIEVKAAPMKQTGVGKNAKTENHPEQHTYLLVYPWKKK